MQTRFDSDVLQSAKELKALGFAIHWLKQESKAPVSREWQNTPPPDIETLIKTHKSGRNIGVRLGKPSQLVDGQYLYVLDFDIRIKGVQKEIVQHFEELFPEVDIKTLPRVKSGSGGDSFHAYFVSDKPMRGKKLAQSDAKIRKFDPVTKKEKWSREWEIELFGTGKQVVLPPSIHPETKKPYKWVEEFNLDCYEMGITPHIPSEQILAITEPTDETFAFEDQEPIKMSDKKIDSLLDQLSYDYLNDYETWVALGQALHHQYGGDAAGFDLWMKYSAKSEKFDESQINKYRRTHWRSFGRYQSGALITMRSIIEAVRDNVRNELRESMEEIEEVDEDNDSESKELPSVKKDSSNDETEDEEYMLSSKPTDWIALLAVTDDGSIKSNLHNVRLIVNNDSRIKNIIRKNSFTGDIVITKAAARRKRKAGSNLPCVNLIPDLWKKPATSNGTLVTDVHVADLRSIIEAPQSQGGYNLKVNVNDLNNAIDTVAAFNEYHPVGEYLEKLTWDNVPRIDELFVKYLGAEDNDYSRMTARLWMIAAVTRIFEPAHKFDFAPILEGVQGAGKSTFAAVLGKSWTTSLDDDFGDRRRMVETMTGAWIIEIDELSAFKKSDVRAIKSFMSTTTDKVRLAYGKRSVIMPRQCVFIGSTNDGEYLNDPTGGRRFWPIKCHSTIDIASLREDVDLLWAEAYIAYKEMRAAQPKGELPLYLSDPDVEAYARTLQEDCRSESEDEELCGIISDWLETPIQTEEDEDFGDGEPQLRNITCIAQIKEELLKARGISATQAKTFVISRAMRQLCEQGLWQKVDKRPYLPRYGRQRCWERIVK